MERTNKGLFQKGNQVAKGNKGNTNPKWGNMNAMKSGQHAIYSGLSYYQGQVYLVIKHYSIGMLDKNDYYIENDQIFLTDKMAHLLIENYHLSKQSFISLKDSTYKRFSDKKAFKMKHVKIYHGENYEDTIIQTKN